MYNLKERIKEIAEEHFKWYAKGGLEYSSKDFYDIIISQEKSMIEQAKKEAREEFADKIRLEMNTNYIFYKDYCIFKKDIDKLLKEYGEKI
jgi:hypothetical protein